MDVASVFSCFVTYRVLVNRMHADWASWLDSVNKKLFHVGEINFQTTSM